MRHFLKFLSPDKRAEAERLYGQPATAEEQARQLKKRRSAPKPNNAPKPNKEAPKAQAKASPKLSRVPSKDMLVELPPRRAEFGGLIERRKLKNRPAPAEERRNNGLGSPDKNSFSYVGRARLGASKHAMRSAQDTEVSNTGTYLNALDNSAITLQDSGIFKQEPEEPSFNPYDKGRS